MTGAEHYREAERFAEDASPPREGIDWDMALLALAQVHATLALAAATALSGSSALPVPDWQAWHAAAATPRKVTHGGA